jgi:hypothetical protein
MNYGNALRYDPWPGSDSTGRFAEAVAEGISIARPEVSAPTTSREAPWMKPTRDKIYELAGLREDNWDGRGSAAVRTDVLAFVWTILGQVMPYNGEAPGIIPLGHGGVQLEWRAPDRELELEIARPHEIEATLFNINNSAEYEIRADTEHLDILTGVIWQNIPRI